MLQPKVHPRCGEPVAVVVLVEATAFVVAAVAQTVDGEDFVVVAAGPHLQMAPVLVEPPKQPQFRRLNRTPGTFLPQATQRKMRSPNPPRPPLRSQRHLSLPQPQRRRLGPVCLRQSPSLQSPSHLRSQHRLQKSPHLHPSRHRPRRSYKNP